MVARRYDISDFFIILPGVLVDLLTFVVEIGYLFCLLTISLTLKMLRQGTHLYQKLFLSKSPCAAEPVILHEIRIFAV